MPCVYSVQLPAREQVELSQLLRILEQWVNLSEYRTFSKVSFQTDNYVRCACSEAELTYVRVNYPTLQIALKTETAMTQTDTKRLDSNLLWAAHFLMTTLDKTTFHIQLYRSPDDGGRSCDMNVPIHIPAVFKLLIYADMLQDDHGIPFSCKPVHMDEDLKQIVDGILREQKCTSIPIVILSDYDIASRLAKRLSGAAHILVSNEEANISLYFPRTRAHKIFPLSDDPQNIEDIFNHVIQATYASASDQTPTFEQIERQLRPGEKCSASISGYVLVSAEMSQMIRTKRKKLGMTQAELAEGIGTTGLVISRIERQETRRVEEGLLHRIEEALGLVAGELAAMESVVELKKEPTKKCVPVQAEDVDSLYCFKCGVKLIENAQFCHRCGVRIPL